MTSNTIQCEILLSLYSSRYIQCTCHFYCHHPGLSHYHYSPGYCISFILVYKLSSLLNLSLPMTLVSPNCSKLWNATSIEMTLSKIKKNSEWLMEIFLYVTSLFFFKYLNKNIQFWHYTHAIFSVFYFSAPVV